MYTYCICKAFLKHFIPNWRCGQISKSLMEILQALSIVSSVMMFEGLLTLSHFQIKPTWQICMTNFNKCKIFWPHVKFTIAIEKPVKIHQIKVNVSAPWAETVFNPEYSLNIIAQRLPWTVHFWENVNHIHINTHQKDD